ncbi:MAG: hypothetical protein A4S09_15690 [Proteobacteria bacterium SG_bin7]|nr:MAG: hypothetical protein A4S09_15690 [Proteobacteria bacterium SG_bin7]
MKNLFLSLLIFSFIAPAFADEDTDPRPRENKRRVLRHERRRERNRMHEYQLEFVKPYTTYEIQKEPSGGTNPVSSSHTERGIRFTYAPLKKKTLGYFFAVAYLEYGGSNSNSLRLESGGSYTFSKLLYSLVGVQLHKFLNAETAQIIDLGYGVQALLGFQITQQFGVKLGYTYTKFIEKEFGGSKINTTFLSPEIGVYWAF